MNIKNVFIFLAVIIATTSFYLVFTGSNSSDLVAGLNEKKAEHIQQQKVIESVDSPSAINETSNSVEKTDNADSVITEVENLDVANGSELALSLLEIFGEGVPFEMSPEAQDRLLAKIGSTNANNINELHKKAEYDPAYDATWSTDVQIKAIEEVNNHFSDNATVSQYDCLGGKCSLKVSLGGGEGLPYSSAGKFMTSLRSSPAILKSGAKRDIFLNQINVDENGERFVDYTIGNVDEINGPATN